jgi:L-gulonolactone oxidase
MPTFQNWNGGNECFPSRIQTPTTTKAIQNIVQYACKHNKRIRVVGRGVHTYGYISMCDQGDIIMSLQNYNKVIDINLMAKTITAQAGIDLEDMIAKLEDRNVRLALRNMGEITKQCLGGVTATGTHGSGGGRGATEADSFSDQVVSFTIMECTPEATIHVIHKTTGTEEFKAMMTHLGTLAIVLEIELQLVDWYHLEWSSTDIGTFPQLSVETIKQRHNQVYSLAYTYFPATDEMVEVVRDLTNNTKESGISSDVIDDLVGILRQGASQVLQRFPGLIGPYAVLQKRTLLTLKGSDMWRKVLSQGDLWGGVNLTLTTDLEYAVPIDKTVKALACIREILRTQSTRVHSVVGIRFVRGSEALLACHYASSTSQVFSFLNVQLRTTKPDHCMVNEIQSKMMAMGGRPHWGKYNTTTRSMIESNRLWPQFNLKSFLAVKAKYDPNNILGNAYLDRALGLSKLFESAALEYP